MLRILVLTGRFPACARIWAISSSGRFWSVHVWLKPLACGTPVVTADCRRSFERALSLV